jgi:hypothetical protein
MAHKHGEMPTEEWVTFPGGELEGKRPKALCDACRKALKTAVLRRRKRPEPRRPLCFQCYRAGLERDRALRAAGEINTATDVRFQFQLPFEAVDRPRLERLKVDRIGARAAMAPASLDRRRAQIDARHVLQQIAAGLRSRGLASDPASGERAMFQAVHAAELQLPESWLPFVMSR